MGLCTRYDACVKPSAPCLERLQGKNWIPVCPEQLGGLPTPRPAAGIVDGTAQDVLEKRAKVITRNGDDVTAQFLSGAHQVLSIAQSQPIQAVFLKANSPSCGVNSPQGVTAALLSNNGFSLHEF